MVFSAFENRTKESWEERALWKAELGFAHGYLLPTRASPLYSCPGLPLSGTLGPPLVIILLYCNSGWKNPQASCLPWKDANATAMVRAVQSGSAVARSDNSLTACAWRVSTDHLPWWHKRCVATLKIQTPIRCSWGCLTPSVIHSEPVCSILCNLSWERCSWAMQRRPCRYSSPVCVTVLWVKSFQSLHW